jgi:cytidyltransferase-like protein
MNKKIVIISGYFNPLHGGHIDYMAAAKQLGDELWVIINNDQQQLLKKGKIIMSQNERMKVVGSIRYVDRMLLSIDSDGSQCATLKKLVRDNPGNQYVFANGGDRNGDNIPEVAVCKEYGIELIFNVGGSKIHSSSEINRLTGDEK